MTESQIAPPGLKGLAVADTVLGDVRGQEGFFHYRQYDASQLAVHRTLEDAWTLQVDGALPPTVPTIDGGAHRTLPSAVGALVDAAAECLADPMNTLRVGILGVAEREGRGPTLDRTAGELRGDAIRLAAVVPTILARHHRRRQGLDPIEPSAELGHAA
ncbi:MAG: citrate/2-methylcitrate synthase, partial [Actinomycetota bacterium]